MGSVGGFGLDRDPGKGWVGLVVGEIGGLGDFGLGRAGRGWVGLRRVVLVWLGRVRLGWVG